MQATQTRRGLKTVGIFREALDILVCQTPLLGLPMKFKNKNPIPKPSAPDFTSWFSLE